MIEARTKPYLARRMTTSIPSIRKLASETVIYGLSSVVGRAVSFILLPIYTGVFSTTEYGVQSLVYTYAAFIFVFFVLRFDTAYFRFASDDTYRKNSFSTAFSAVGLTSLILSTALFICAPWLADVVFNIADEYVYLIRILALILFFDALSEIPYAQLRLENRPIRFASIRLTNIFINVGLNCIFLLLIPWLIEQESFSSAFNWYIPEIGIGYIFISNLVASVVAFFLLFPQWKVIRFQVDKKLLKLMWRYAGPLVIVGLAGIVNELIDRAMLDRLLPYDDDTNKAQAGIYSAAYKFSILISLFIQAYRYAAEPFFFKYAKDKNSPKVYARAAEYFVLAACIGFLCIMFYLPWLKYLLRQTDYHEGVIVVPILIMANIFLGIYYNLSVWYKLTDKTRYAMYIAIGGAIITIALNVILIPIWGYVGSAWATLACYSVMTFLSFYVGRQHYPLAHKLWRMIGYMIFSVVLYFGSVYVVSAMTTNQLIQQIIYTAIIAMVCAATYTLITRQRELA